VVLLGFLWLPFGSGNENSLLAEEPLTYELFSESFDGTSLNRVYEIKETGASTVIVIPIPTSLLPAISASDQPVLEAKKRLTEAYTTLKRNDLLQELNHVKIIGNDEITLSVSFPYKTTFHREQTLSYQYAEETHTTEKDYNKKDPLLFPDVNNERKTKNETPEPAPLSDNPNQTYLEKTPDEINKPKDLPEEGSDTADTDKKKLFLPIVIVCSVLAITVFLLKKRR
jgi:hypothetical protein